MKKNEGVVREDRRELRKGWTQETRGRWQEGGPSQQDCCVTSGEESLKAQWIKLHQLKSESTLQRIKGWKGSDEVSAGNVS